MITQKCHVCGEARPGDQIGVRIIEVSLEYGLPPDTMQMNVRYCRDKPECTAMSKDYRFGLRPRQPIF